MSLTVKILSRSRLDGGGRDINGVAKNAKTEVVGELAGAYVTGGIAFTATDIGLETIDFLDLQPVTLAAAAGAGLIETDTAIGASLDEPNAVIRCTTINNGGVTTQAAQTAYVINFRAFGDSAESPELT